MRFSTWYQPLRLLRVGRPSLISVARRVQRDYNTPRHAQDCNLGDR